MAARMSPAEFAKKWADKTGAAGDAYEKGINAVQGNPAQMAIAAKDRLVSNFVASVQDGRWEAGLAKTTEGGWKAACIQKGKPQLATAARLAMDKVQRAEAEMGPIRESVRASLPPRGDVMQNLERQRQMALGMYEARRRRG